MKQSIRTLALVVCMAALPSTAPAQVSRGQQLTIDHGLQLQPVVTLGDLFHHQTVIDANYTATLWAWDSNTSEHGAAPGFPWARWVRSPAEMPPRPGYNEEPYMSKLVSLQIGDEYDLNNDVQRQQTIDWLNAARPNFPNAMLIVNNYGGQVNDAALADLIARGRPDVISFDTYPYLNGAQPVGGTPINWYADMRRYRQHGLATNTPVGQYRQAFHDNVWRDPSPSEFRLNTFGALAFNVKYMGDFIYNTGNSAFFNGPGDTNPKPLYNDLKQVNVEARNLGKALVRLKPVNDAPGAQHTTSMMFIRGRHTENGAAVRNQYPGYMGFADDPQSLDYTDWEFGRNDPYLSGPFNDASILNIAGTKNDGLDGDVIISWFKPIDESFDGDAFADQRYIMVTNGLADMTGSAQDTRQRIRLNFGSSAVRFPYDHLEKLDRLTGEVVDVPLNRLTTNVWQLELLLDGGTSELFKFPTGAPFVGVVPEPAGLAVLGLAGLLLLRSRREP